MKDILAAAIGAAMSIAGTGGGAGRADLLVTRPGSRVSREKQKRRRRRIRIEEMVNRWCGVPWAHAPIPLPRADSGRNGAPSQGGGAEARAVRRAERTPPGHPHPTPRSPGSTRWPSG